MDLQEIREQIQQIRTLIRGGKVSEAVASLDGLSQSIRDPNLRDEIIALSSNHRRLENDARQGLLDGHDLNLRQNRLIQQSLSLLTLLEKEFAGQREQVNTIQRELKQQKKKNNLLLIILPLLLLVFIVGGIWLFKPSPPPATSDCERFLREGFAAFENSKYTLAKDALINAKYFCGEERNELKIARVDQLLAAVAAAAEKKRQEENPVKPPKQATGSITVELKNFGTNCTIYYAKLWSPSDMSFDTLQQTFSANCQTIFLDLKDGTYVVDLYAKSTFELGYMCNGCPSGLVSKNKVTIVNGSREAMSFTPKSSLRKFEQRGHQTAPKVENY